MAAPVTAPARGRGRPRIGTRVVLTVPDDVLAHVDAAATAAGHDRADEIRARLAAPTRRKRRRKTVHEHEAWQIRESEDGTGRRYCAACGDDVP